MSSAREGSISPTLMSPVLRRRSTPPALNSLPSTSSMFCLLTPIFFSCIVCLSDAQWAASHGASAKEQNQESRPLDVSERENVVTVCVESGKLTGIAKKVSLISLLTLS